MVEWETSRAILTRNKNDSTTSACLPAYPSDFSLALSPAAQDPQKPSPLYKNSFRYFAYEKRQNANTRLAAADSMAARAHAVTRVHAYTHTQQNTHIA